MLLTIDVSSRAEAICVVGWTSEGSSETTRDDKKEVGHSLTVAGTAAVVTKDFGSVACDDRLSRAR